MPGQAIWLRYGDLARRIVAETSPDELEAVITAMLRKAHEKGLHAMQAKAVKAVQQVVRRKFHSKGLQELMIIRELRALEANASLRPVRWQMNGKRHDFLWRETMETRGAPPRTGMEAAPCDQALREDPALRTGE